MMPLRKFPAATEEKGRPSDRQFVVQSMQTDQGGWEGNPGKSARLEATPEIS